MADWILEQEEWDYDEALECLDEGYWMQRNGQLIKISKMTDSHLENVIRLFRKNGRPEFVVVLEEEVEKRRLKKLKKEMMKDPRYLIFKAGWDAGYKCCSQKAWPEVGPFAELTFDKAWEEFKKNEKRNSR